MNKHITIDGPAGSGKSTIAKLIAEKLNLIYIDTGAMFRAIGLYMTEHKISCEDLSQITTELKNIKLDISYKNNEQQIILNGRNVNSDIRKPEIGKIASDFAIIPEVRERLLNLQRELATKNSVVMDGRDIGTKVLPDAAVKIFLTADIGVRTERRYKELLAKGIKVNLSDLTVDIKNRDKQDTTRKIAPLVKAEDAIIIDTSFLTTDEVVNKVIDICNKNPAFSS